MEEKFKIENACIESTMLGTEDHGVLTCFLHLKFDGTGQGFGGWCFDTPLGKRSSSFERVGTAWGTEFIRRVLKTLEVERWEQLKGEHCRADHSWTKVRGIGHIVKDQWFYPERDLAHLKIDEVAA